MMTWKRIGCLTEFKDITSKGKPQYYIWLQNNIFTRQYNKTNIV